MDATTVQDDQNGARPGSPGDGPSGRPRVVAIIDRDEAFLMVLANRLERIGWKLHPLSPRARTKTLDTLDADALVLDISILGAQRWKWLARLREQRPDLPLVVCTGPSTVIERIAALRGGVDDWLNKPCHAEELIARIEAVTGYNRAFVQNTMDSLWFAELEIRPHLFQAYVRGESLRLTRREYELLDALTKAEAKIIAREVIFATIWHTEMVGYDRSVDMLVHKVRRKLEDASPQWRYIHTHYRRGYRLEPEPVNETQELVRLPFPTSVAATLAA